MAQAVHAAFDVAVADPLTVRDWAIISNYVVVLSVADEPALATIAAELRARHVSVREVTEPDLDNQLTAIVVLPHPEAHKVLSKLPLALKKPAMA